MAAAAEKPLLYLSQIGLPPIVELLYADTALMGKKSKKNAVRAKGKAGESSSAVASATVGSAVAPAAAAATLTTSATASTGTSDAGNGSERSNGGVLVKGGNDGSSRKLKCVRCCSSLKDLAKAHQCPGCAQLYCWRCEKKTFLACLNGRNCVKPLRRCEDCYRGRTSKRVLLECTGIFMIKGEVPVDDLLELLAKDERLSDAAVPFSTCHSRECLWDKTVIDELGNRWNVPFARSMPTSY